MFAMVASRSVPRTMGLQPSGSFTDDRYSESLMSAWDRSTVIESGMLSAGTRISTECSTMFNAPPFLMPGQVSWLMKCTGTSTRRLAPAFRRRKSTCMGVSFTTSSW